MQRSQLDSQIDSTKVNFENAFQRLKELSPAEWYPSVFVERRWKRDFAINPRGDNLNESLTLGWVLRIFNGETLFEQAGDDFSADGINAGIEELLKQVRAAPRPCVTLLRMPEGLVGKHSRD